MMNRLLVVIMFLGVTSALALAENDRYLIIIENGSPISQNKLIGYLDRCWAKTADKIYLDGDSSDLAWLTQHNITFRTAVFDDDRFPLFLCYRGDEKPDIEENKILDRGIDYILTTEYVENARFCRQLRPHYFPFAQSEFPSNLVLNYDPRIQTIIDNVSQDSLLYYLSGLSGYTPINIGGQLDTIHTRYSGTADIVLAAQYIKQILDSYGYQASLQGYFSGALRHVAAFNANLAWAVSESGVAYRTQDGGASWPTMATGVATSLWGISHVGADSLWVTGNGGVIRFSSNGGNSFVGQNAATNNYLFGSSFISPSKGWIAADSGLVYRTINSGANWSRQTTPVSNRLYDICFIDSTYGWAVGATGTIIHSTDGGLNWAQQTSNTTERLYGVDFISRNNGWAIGLGGVVRHTTDGGSAWQSVNLGTTRAKYHVDFTDSLHGFIAGFDGEIFITNSGGLNWQLINPGTGKDFYGVDFSDSLTGFAVGTGIVIKTTDGGNTWINQVGAVAGAWLNVVAEKTGAVNPGQQVIICGHYDSRSQTSPTNAPGADDNGSGTIGVIEAARIFTSESFEKTIKFCLWSGEEQGLYGSADYAAEAYYRGDSIVGVFNFDMIAYDGNGDGSAELHCGTGASSQALGNIFTTVVSDYSLSLDPDLIGAGALTASDHSSFWNYNFPAMLGIEDYSGDFNPYYHTTSDNMSHIMASYFTNFTKAAVGAVATAAIPTYDSTGAIAGRVLDESSNPIAGALISISGFAITDTSDFSGDFFFSGLNPGTYTLNCTHSDYRDTSYTGILVVSGDTTFINIVMTSGCAYSSGDINDDGLTNGADVTYGVRYFKGFGAPPPDSCANDSVQTTRGNWLYVAADVNGDCNHSGADITRLVAYFKGFAQRSFCRFFPTPTIRNRIDISDNK